MNAQEIRISGIPDNVPEATAAVCRSRILMAAEKLMSELDTPELLISVGTKDGFAKLQEDVSSRSSPRKDDPEPSRYQAVKPFFTFEQLIVSEELMTELLAAVNVLEVEAKVFDEWGLREVEPFPKTALNFHGAPGTGKTLAAHALANRVGRPIIVASYAEIESKFHGDGPKNVKAIFEAAERDGAVLFIDEADSLLSRRLTNVTQGSEQAINSMRSQLLICLEQFHGAVIFSTNLVKNYDKAFETRIRHIHFEMPDEGARAKIWARHLVDKLPLAADVSAEDLGRAVEDLCGRDIKNAVVDAAVRAATAQKDVVDRQDLVDAAERIKAARVQDEEPKPRKLPPEEAKEVAGKIRAAMGKSEGEDRVEVELGNEAETDV